MTYRRPTKPIATPVALPPDDGLILYLPCQEGSGRFTADLSGKDNHCTLNGPKWTSSPKGAALKFDGLNDVGTVSNSSIIGLGLGLKFSISLWFSPLSFTMYDSFIKIGAFDAANNGLVIGLYDADFLYIDTYTTAYDPALPASMSSGSWYHVVLTADGTYFRVYFQGVRLTTTLRNPNIADGSSIIGHSILTRYFDGLMKNIRAYNRVLSGDEIRRIYETEK